MIWSVVKEKAVREDGTLFFPEKLNEAFLHNVKRSMGSYVYANQYLNEIIPDDEKKFKKEWFRYFDTIPDGCLTFGFIDPAISRKDGSDWTALVVVAINYEGNFYVLYANRFKYTPTQIVDLAFKARDRFGLQVLGIEDIAYQKSLLYMINDKGKREGRFLPTVGIGSGDARSKDSRILGLVPRFEWSRIYLKKGLDALENELNFFPRGSKDVLDALARCEHIAYAPTKERNKNDRPAPNSPEYEKWFIQNIHKVKRD